MGGCLSSPADSSSTRSPGDGRTYAAVPSADVFIRRPRSILPDCPACADIREKYRFVRELGRGEFGVTHQCIDLGTGEAVACKSISKAKLRSEIDVQDVRREVEIMRCFPRHPNIVRFREAYEDGEAVHLVMELCEGGELFDRIVARGHYTERAAATVTKTIVEVVQMCHKHGVMHRDLKPENFLFANSSESAPLKAIDFGLSIFFNPGDRFAEIVGSPYYMAPEVLMRNYGSEVDIWSAGVILYILLCGVPPFWAESEEGIAQAIVRCCIDFERDPWPKVSKDARDIVSRMLDPNPYNRLRVEEVLGHPWIQNCNKVPNIPLGENVKARIKQFTLMNKFKKRALRVVADNLPDEQVNGIKQLFQDMDTDKNENLSFKELKDGLHLLGHPVTDPDVKMLMDAADVDGNGMLDCGEFVTMSVHLRRISSDKHLAKAFSFFDQNNNGYIEIDELKEALVGENLGSNYDQAIQDIISDMDIDKDGQISYEDFREMMRGTDWKMGSRQYSRAMLNTLSLKLFKGKSMQPK